MLVGPVVAEIHAGGDRHAVFLEQLQAELLAVLGETAGVSVDVEGAING